MLARLFDHWVYGGFLAGLMFLAFMPLLAAHWSPAFTAIFLLLPVYMLHQYEEHDADRFRLYVNRTIGHGAEVLTPAAVFVINIGAVWLLGLIVVYLAWWFGSGFGLISVYLMLVNAAVHIVGAVRTRGYNPGLGTAVVLFLPVGFYAFWRIQASGEAGAADHAVGLVVGVAVHALIVVYAVRRRSVLETSKLAEPSSR